MDEVIYEEFKGTGTMEIHLNRTTITYEEVAGKGAKAIGFDQVALDVATPYAAEDAAVTQGMSTQEMFQGKS